VKRSLIVWVILAFAGWTAFIASSCSKSPQQIRIAVDANWYPLNFQDKQAYVNGFIDELLLEISRHSHIEFQKISANWDTLMEGLDQQRYDVVLSSLPPYPFNQVKYDFSNRFLDIGPVLVLPVNSQWNSLTEMTNEVVGVLFSNQEWFAMQKDANVIMRSYDSIPEIFNALGNGEVEGIVVDRLTAVGFVKGTYAGKLKICHPALTDAGLRMIALKDDRSQAVRKFNQSLDYLVKKKKLEKMLKKWNLTTQIPSASVR
jgi:ABC-type amino acid transport substrate-binding protein